MANTQGISGEFKKDAMAALLDGKSALKIALYLTTATINNAVTDYQTTGEVSGTGYTAGGKILSNTVAVATNTQIAYWTPSADVTWSTVTLSSSFDCALIYDNAATPKRTVGAFTFGATTVGGGDFTLTMPTNNKTTALVRFN